MNSNITKSDSSDKLNSKLQSMLNTVGDHSSTIQSTYDKSPNQTAYDKSPNQTAYDKSPNQQE